MAKKAIDFKEYIDKSLECLHVMISIEQGNIKDLSIKISEMKVEEKVLGAKINILKSQVNETEICLHALRNSSLFQKIRFLFSPYSRY